MGNQVEKIFGYGSLINEDSLRITVPDAYEICPVLLRGYKRVFNTRSSSRKDPDGNHSCVLTLEKSSAEDVVNGICFSLPAGSYDDLREREAVYDLLDVELCGWPADQKAIKAHTWIATDIENYPYQYHSPSQREYLEICCEGCAKFGEQFLAAFLQTTYIESKSLKELLAEGAIQL